MNLMRVESARSVIPIGGSDRAAVAANQHGKVCYRAYLIFCVLTCTFCLSYYYVRTDGLQFVTTPYYPSADYFQSHQPDNYNESEIHEEEVRKGYVVWSPGCRIPNISANHESIKKFVKKVKLVKCSDKNPLTRVVYDRTSDQYTLEIVKKYISQYLGKKKGETVVCCYSTIKREQIKARPKGDDDDRYVISASKCFRNKVTLNRKIEAVYVKCSATSSSQIFSVTVPFILPTRSREVYKNVHGVVIRKATSQQKKSAEDDNEKPNVLLIGLDSISRLNMIRTMPKTVAYLEQNNWINLQGYTKVADNTFPNLIPILTGLDVDQLRKRCWPSPKQKLDGCPFLWKDFKNQSYVTAYVEDEPTIGSFNYRKYGFFRQPTDHYPRPMMLAAEKLLKVKTIDGLSYCLGPVTSIDHILDYCLDMVRVYHNTSTPYFGLFWSNTFSHNDLNEPSSMDEVILGFFKKLAPFLENTVVVFLSDHGMRFGKIRETFVGWLEERMPFIYYWLPASFRRKYPEKYRNMISNKNRLSSPFDVHLTIKEVLYGEDSGAGTDGCKHCRSLFHKAKWNRTCEEAAISSHWCTCSSEFEEVPSNDPSVMAAIDFVIATMNKDLQKAAHTVSNGTVCAALKLKSIISVRSKVQRMFSPKEYVIVFSTKPSEAIFEVTVTQRGRNFTISGSVSRINAYGSQSYCIPDAVMKKYCFCVKKS